MDTVPSGNGETFPEDVFLTATQGRSTLPPSCQLYAENPDQQTSTEVIQWVTNQKHTYSYWSFLWAHPGTPQNCHSSTNDRVHSDYQL